MNLHKIKNINFLFIFIIILLSLIGTVALYSAGDGNFNPWAKKHIIRFTFSLALLLLIVLIDIKLLYKYSYVIFFLCLLLLFSVEIIGTFEKGAERWIRIFGISIQPSELIKVSIILALARFYHDLRINKIGQIRNLFVPMTIIIIPFILVAMQPDLGTSLSIILLGVFIMFFAGVRIWKFIASLIVIFFSFPFFWNFIKPYQQRRILSFLNPEIDPLGQGYQLIQSKIALGSGGLTGKGFLMGSQSHLKYLPEKQTDFIFTLIGEEFGFIGTIFIIFLFFALILIAFYICIKSTHVFGKILSIGVAINLFLYVALNMGMVTGLMPVVGIPLPLISYGGTALLSIMISFSLLLNVEVHYNYNKLKE
jgi:rod shape determining protein RodA